MLTILHIGNYKDPPMHGVAHAIGGLAEAEAALGHEVHVYSPQRDFSSNDVAIARARGFRLHGRGSPVVTLIEKRLIDVAHIHYLFEPRHFRFGEALKQYRVPYVVSPHGALDPMEFTRARVKGLKKRAYLRLVDRRMLSRAAAIRCVTEREKARVSAVLPAVATRVIPNCVPGPPSQQRPESGDGIRIGYLGRLDPYHKGLDLLAEVQESLLANGLAVEVVLAGKATERDRTSFEEFMNRRGDLNVRLVGPVHGEQKWSFLSGLTVYAQLSRWELFGISMIEAMLAGTPVLASASCDLAPELGMRDLALVTPRDARSAADLLATSLGDSGALLRRASRARRWAEETFAPRAVAAQSTCLYEGL
ncbi:MAG: glycosyltransferase [Roseovarius sp.]|nr:glycosyltransferase [Roseovarius sp.]